VTGLLKFAIYSASWVEDANDSNCSHYTGSSLSLHSYAAAGFPETIRPLDPASFWAVAIGVPA
jgi:hypothetical protein